jgi:hypothetical protein
MHGFGRLQGSIEPFGVALRETQVGQWLKGAFGGMEESMSAGMENLTYKI